MVVCQALKGQQFEEGPALTCLPREAGRTQPRRTKQMHRVNPARGPLGAGTSDGGTPLKALKATELYTSNG